MKRREKREGAICPGLGWGTAESDPGPAIPGLSLPSAGCGGRGAAGCRDAHRGCCQVLAAVQFVGLVLSWAGCWRNGGWLRLCN